MKTLVFTSLMCILPLLNYAQGYTLDDIPAWIDENITFPEEANQYGMAGIEQFVISATWDGRVFITSGLNTLNPAFEEEIKRVVSKAPQCRFAGNSVEDVYKLVTIDFSTYVPDERQVENIGRYVPPQFAPRGERPRHLKGEEQFLKWLSSQFRLPQNDDFTGYCDTVSLCYTVTDKGRLKDVRVEGCRSESIKTELENIMKRAPRWKPAVTETRTPIPVSIKEAIIIRTDEHGKNIPFKLYVDEVYRNASNAPADPSMLVLNPEVRIQYAGNNGDFVRTIRDSLQVDSRVEFAGSFVVERDGTISNLHTVATNAKVDSIVTALVEHATWIPARQGGQTVRSVYSFAGTQTPPTEYVYATPPHKRNWKTRWNYFKEAYPEMDAEVLIYRTGNRTLRRFLGSDEYQEALMERGYPLYKNGKRIKTKK